MDLVSNFAGSISPSMFGNNTQGITPNINLDDNTFSDMLEQQLLKKNEPVQSNFIDTLGIPTGFNIADLANHNAITPINTEDKFDAVKAVNEFEKSNLQDYNNPKDFSTSEIITFFNSLFESKPTLTDNINSGLFEFELRTAANQYSKYAKNIATNLGEFVSDALNLS